MFSQAKLILAAVVVAIIGGLLWREHYLVGKVKRIEAEKTQLAASLASSEKARATEIADRRSADESAKSLQAELDRIRSEPRITGVRCRTSLPRSSSESGTASIATGTAAEPLETVPAGDSVGPERDVSVGLDWYGSKCAETAATLTALQEWELRRTH